MQNLGKTNLLDDPDYYCYQDLPEMNRIVSGVNDIIAKAENLGIENFTNCVCELALKQIDIKVVSDLPQSM